MLKRAIIFHGDLICGFQTAISHYIHPTYEGVMTKIKSRMLDSSGIRNGKLDFTWFKGRGV